MFDKDFTELLSAFAAHRVKYLVIGGYAVSFHAQPRATKDLDLFIGSDPVNAQAVYAALVAFGAPLTGLAPEDFTDPDMFYRMGSPPQMVDILPAINGVDFDSAWSNQVQVVVDEATGLTASFIALPDLIASKLAAGRPQDLADVAALRAATQNEA